MLTVEWLARTAPLAATDAMLHGEVTTMALGLDAAMARRGVRGWLSRRRYRKIWGQAWRPLMLAAIDSLDTPRYERSLLSTAAR